MGHPVSSNGDFITLALVVKTQGRRGEVAVKLQSVVPERFAAGMKLLALAKTPPETQDLRRELQVEDLWPHKGMLVLKFAGLDSISDAEILVGAELQVPRSQRAKLETGWTYVSDLVGCVVLDHGRQVGRIEDVQFGAGEAPLLIVTSEAGTKFDVPFAEAYLEAVEVARRQVRMNLPEGMLEINAPVTSDETQEQRSHPKKKH
ncbi:MAG TPA: ribosome maturation factor RimM [Candidatus Sulfotelmatobacter sp.]|jgi:16S rRNA processing protein RimM|nr:ribosome maturation factor RimM [Candidatus Sulfotelmatobacter sp.]